jgi:YggT family protein
MLSNTGNAALLLVNTVLGLYTIAVLLRFVLQLVVANPYNPIAQFLIRITDPPLGLLRRVVPRYRRVDTAAILLMLILAVISIELDLAIIGIQALPGSVILWSILRLVVLALNMYFFTIIIEAIFSWFHTGHSSAMDFLCNINEPLLGPVRRFVPTVAGLDLSPLIVIIAVQVVSSLIPLPGVFR